MHKVARALPEIHAFLGWSDMLAQSLDLIELVDEGPSPSCYESWGYEDTFAPRRVFESPSILLRLYRDIILMPNEDLVRDYPWFEAYDSSRNGGRLRDRLFVSHGISFAAGNRRMRREVDVHFVVLHEILSGEWSCVSETVSGGCKRSRKDGELLRRYKLPLSTRGCKKLESNEAKTLVHRMMKLIADQR